MSTATVTQLIPLATILIALALTAFFLTRKGYPKRTGTIIVRCGQGHLFTTIWIPFVSFKAVRLGPTRFQYCPVGRHWAFVVAVDEAQLSDEEIQIASEHQDSNIP
jgi:hypothetical protein